jgi:hypothetical protein
MICHIANTRAAEVLPFRNPRQIINNENVNRRQRQIRQTKKNTKLTLGFNVTISMALYKNI